jgi:hypothetical protein
MERKKQQVIRVSIKYPSLLNQKSCCETFLSTHATRASLISNQR